MRACSTVALALMSRGLGAIKRLLVSGKLSWLGPRGAPAGRGRLALLGTLFVCIDR